MQQEQIMLSPQGHSLQKAAYHLSALGDYILWMSYKVGLSASEQLQSLILSTENKELLQSKKNPYYAAIHKLSNELKEKDKKIKELESILEKNHQKNQERNIILQALLEHNTRYTQQIASVLSDPESLPHPDLVEETRTYFTLQGDDLNALTHLSLQHEENMVFLYNCTQPYRAFKSLNVEEYELCQHTSIPKKIQSVITAHYLYAQKHRQKKQLLEETLTRIENICQHYCPCPPLKGPVPMSRRQKIFSEQCLYWSKHLAIDEISSEERELLWTDLTSLNSCESTLSQCPNVEAFKSMIESKNNELSSKSSF